MATAKDFRDPEKKASPISSDYDAESGTVIDKRTSLDGSGRKASLTGRKSSVAETIIAADLLDERYATTQRGLKSRHAQMIALGGTIGTGYVLLGNTASPFLTTSNNVQSVRRIRPDTGSGRTGIHLCSILHHDIPRLLHCHGSH